MNTHNDHTIIEMLEELQAIVDYYKPQKNYLIGVVALSVLAIFNILILSEGVFWGLLLFGVGICTIITYAVEYLSLKSPTTEKELAERACQIMSGCVSRYEHPEREIHVLQYNSYFGGNNLSLYNKFIGIFPQMASKKLKKLASIRDKIE